MDVGVRHLYTSDTYLPNDLPRLVPELLAALNERPERVRFPQWDARQGR